MSCAKPAPYDNSWLGNMNCYVTMYVTWKRKALIYDGTTLGLTKALVVAGAKPGDTCQCEFGHTYMLEATPHDQRAGGFWASRVTKQSKTRKK